MTIICAMYDKEEKCFWLGSNSQFTIGDKPFPRDASNWQTYGDWALATTGSGVHSTVIEIGSKKFPRNTNNVLDIVSYLMKLMPEYNLYEDDDGYREYNFSGLIVNRSGDLFDFDSYFSVAKASKGSFWARGSGGEFALGAASILKKQKNLPKNIVTAATQAAIDLDVGCPGKVVIKKF